MKLERDHWARLLRLLDDALALPADARSAWLDALALDPPPLKDALRRLLADRRAIETSDFLGAGADTTAWQPQAQVGPWRLQRLLGEGGMASVWLAERADGAHRRPVALKLPHRALAARGLAERFARERAILSTLDHPHIAQVLDAGHDGAQPWLALAYVDGQPITAHAAAHQLDVPARLRLFGQVLQAAQHAHARLVIHRDIKPANVLVTADGQVQLLDFGVAKLLEGDVPGAASDLTQLGGRAMTPQYASPEQVAGRPLGVASDVYSLGVLLYELLTGRLPYQLKRDTAAALEEAILAAQVQPPSQAVADTRTARALRGDVDTIVLKALRPDPAQRYTSAAALADDISRHLQALPISARPPTWGYRLHKLWQRQRLALAASALLLGVIGFGVASTLWQARRAQDEARRAEAMQGFLIKLLQTTDPQQGQARELRVGELLDLNAGRVAAEFHDQPALQARMLRTLANLYTARAEPAKGRPLLERAITLLDGLGATARDDAVAARMERVDLLGEIPDPPAMRAALDDAERQAQAQLGPQHRWRGRLAINRAWLAMSDGRLAEAVTLGEQALALMAPGSLDAVRSAGTLATIHIAAGRLLDAQRVLAQAAQDAEQLPELGTTDRLMGIYNLARVRYILGDLAPAEAELRRWLPQFDAVAGPSHDHTLMARALLAQTLAERGQLPEAVAQARANLAAALARQAPDDDQVPIQRATLARMLRLAGQPQEALPLARAALAAIDAKYPTPNGQREAIRRVLAEVLLAGGQAREGVLVLETALAHLKTLGDGALWLPEVQLMLAVALRGGERRGEAVGLIGQACTTLAQQRPAGSLPLLRCEAVRAWVGALQAGPGERGESVERFVEARMRLLAGGLHERHALRAELVAAEAEIAAADPARGAAAGLLVLH